MNISPESIQSLTNELINVKVALFGILFLLIVIAIVFIFGLVEFCRFMKQVKKKMSPSLFKSEASDLLEEDKIEELISISKARLSTYPNSALAHWYLGEAYYRKKKWNEALGEFRKVLALNPSWLKAVDPYIKIIKKMQGESNQKTDQPDTSD